MSEPEGAPPVVGDELPEAIKLVVAVGEDAKANGLLVLDVREVASFTDRIVICTGNSDRHVQAIVDSIRDELAAAGNKPLHTEGYRQAAWVLVDFVDFLVNVFTPEARGFYQLERVWRDAPVLLGERPGPSPASDDEGGPDPRPAAAEAPSESADG